MFNKWPATIVNQILKQMPALAKPQAKFLTSLFAIDVDDRAAMMARSTLLTSAAFNIWGESSLIAIKNHPAYDKLRTYGAIAA